jgi:hypothetical protein
VVRGWREIVARVSRGWRECGVRMATCTSDSNCGGRGPRAIDVGRVAAAGVAPPAGAALRLEAAVPAAPLPRHNSPGSRYLETESHELALASLKRVSGGRPARWLSTIFKPTIARNITHLLHTRMVAVQ